MQCRAGRRHCHGYSLLGVTTNPIGGHSQCHHRRSPDPAVPTDDKSDEQVCERATTRPTVGTTPPPHLLRKAPRLSPWTAPHAPTWVGELDRRAPVTDFAVDRRYTAARLLVTAG